MQDEGARSPGRLDARIARLGRRVRLNGLGHRRLSEDDPRLLLTALLREIDETILPRRLHARPNRGATLQLDVAGRRLLSLTSGEAGRGIVGMPEDPDETARLLAGRLARGLAQASEITLLSQRMRADVERTELGCDALRLARELDLDLMALEGEGRDTRLSRLLARQTRAWVTLAAPGQATAQGGDADEVGRLLAVSRQDSGRLDAMLGAALGGRGIPGCLTLASDGDTRLIVARLGPKMSLALTDAPGLTRLLPVLQDIFAET
jgi:hypothetical protein